LIGAALLAAIFSVTGAAADVIFGPSMMSIISATYEVPTTRYDHGILGDAVEFGALRITISSFGGVAVLRDHVITLPETRVFEDTAPRLVDLDGDERPEIVVVESHQQFGARLAIYGLAAYGPNGKGPGLITSTPYIGQRNRWLAPIGAADLDGDGHIEVAYIDRPHLAKTLRIWRYEKGKLTEIAHLAGLTNHRIGERDIAGGIRTCNGTSEMIVATADWSRLVAVRYQSGQITTRDIGTHTGRSSFASAMTCS
jgi:hypothetical protein